MTRQDKVAACEEKMSQDQIIKRFKKLFGREMTPAERRSFFLMPPSKKEATEA